MSPLAAPSVRNHVAETWTKEIVPTLCDFIRIPNVSVAFDPGWAEAGHMARAVGLVADWLRSRPIDGAIVEVQELPGRTPVVVVDVPAHGEPGPGGSVLLYGHLDKQPPLAEWRTGLGPWEPVRDGERLYGRGGADDGYAAFAALSAIEAVRAAGGAHRRCVVLIEASEESGSPDLPAHLEGLGDRLGGTDLVIALDSWCWSYDRLWVTTSLRGLLGVELTVEVLTEGVHSGMAGGVVPSSFRVLRRLLDRVEDSATGKVLVDELHVDVPEDRLRQIADVAGDLGDLVATYPFAPGVLPLGTGNADRLRARTWEPALEVIAAEGLPSLQNGGNVLRPKTTAGLSFRLPPICDAATAARAVEEALGADPPHGATVTARATTEQGGDAGDDRAEGGTDAEDGADPQVGQGRFVGRGDRAADHHRDAVDSRGPQALADGPALRQMVAGQGGEADQGRVLLLHGRHQ